MNKPLFSQFKSFLRQQFDLSSDAADKESVIEDIKNSVPIKGTQLWILIFAILIASIGLNINATAVIIGAMLMSPLMGPIIGIGFGTAIYDFELIKRSARHFGLAVVVSLIASSLYFLLTPLDQAQTEILARTTPTTWDVFIAFFGGLAGMIATTRKTKSNVIAGVAIATALIPPLCTAGYGLAMGEWGFFFGAAYLFFINSVFICLATFLVTKLLKFTPMAFVNQKTEKHVKRIVIWMAIVTLLPSVFLAYQIVNKSMLSQKIDRFIATEFAYEERQVIDKKIIKRDEGVEVELSVLGLPIEQSELEILNKKIRDTGLKKVKFQVKNLSNGIQSTGAQLESTEKQVELLKAELSKFKESQLPVEEIVSEIRSQFPSVSELYLSKISIDDPEMVQSKYILFGFAKLTNSISSAEVDRIKQYLRARTKSDVVKLWTEQ